MKKIIVGCIALICSVSMWAENSFRIDNFTISAGQKKTIDVKLFNDVDICAFQFELELPEGVRITEKQNGSLNVAATNRLKAYDEFEETWTPVHNVVSALQSNGCYRVMAYAMPSTNISGTSGSAVVRIQIEASDQVSTGEFTPTITKMELTEINETKHKIDPTTYNCSVTLTTTVKDLGYASFSWPKALDFTGSGLTAYIATSCDGSSVHLEPVTKVPANTGLILKGDAGEYNLSTTTDETDDVSGNLLSSNTEDTYTVSGSGIYVLSNKDDGIPGFYPAAEGIHVAQYKSYLSYPFTLSAKSFMVFDDNTTAIDNVSKQETESQGHYYNMQGQRVNKPTKGIYITAGKKYIAN